MMSKIRLKEDSFSPLEGLPESEARMIRDAIEKQVQLLRETLDETKTGAKKKIQILDLHARKLAQQYAEEFRARAEEFRARMIELAKKGEDTRRDIDENAHCLSQELAIEGLIKKLEPLGGYPHLKKIEMSEESLVLLAEFYLNHYNSPENADTRKVHAGMARNRGRSFSKINTDRRETTTLALLTSAFFSGQTLSTTQILELTGYSDNKRTEQFIRALKKGKARDFRLSENYDLVENGQGGWKLEKKEAQ